MNQPIYFPSEIMTNIIDFLRPRPKSKNCIDTVAQLKILCKENNLKVSGNKIDLINRLLTHGLFAKRPFWDTAENNKLCGLDKANPIPYLTFQKHLHTKQIWDEMTELFYNELDIYNNIRRRNQREYMEFNTFFKKNITTYENAIKMYNKHMRKMDKYWQKTEESTIPPSWHTWKFPIGKIINNPYLKLCRLRKEIFFIDYRPPYALR